MKERHYNREGTVKGDIEGEIEEIIIADNTKNISDQKPVVSTTRPALPAVGPILLKFLGSNSYKGCQQTRGRAAQ